jgi:hypothetical protein
MWMDLFSAFKENQHDFHTMEDVHVTQVPQSQNAVATTKPCPGAGAVQVVVDDHRISPIVTKCPDHLCLQFADELLGRGQAWNNVGNGQQFDLNDLDNLDQARILAL